jgi:hypothetical protein
MILIQKNRLSLLESCTPVTMDESYHRPSLRQRIREPMQNRVLSRFSTDLGLGWGSNIRLDHKMCKEITTKTNAFRPWKITASKWASTSPAPRTLSWAVGGEAG